MKNKYKFLPKGWKKPKVTQGSNKFYEVFADVVEKNEFQKDILKLRKILGIPKKGFPENKFKDSQKELIFVPFKATKIILNKYNLHFIFYETIEDYILYNKIERYWDVVGGGNMCLVDDAQELFEDPYTKETQKEDARYYPVLIRIQRNASKRDVIDFINKNFKTIEYIQKKYIPSGQKRRIRKKINRERNNFIYQNRYLKIKELIKKIKSKFGKSPLDFEIRKIVYQEKKRRK